jgi:hypothetical protein
VVQDGRHVGAGYLEALDRLWVCRGGRVVGGSFRGVVLFT